MGIVGRDDCHPDLLLLTLPRAFRRTMFFAVVVVVSQA